MTLKYTGVFYNNYSVYSFVLGIIWSVGISRELVVKFVLRCESVNIISSIVVCL